jgi:hypothetical protein
LVAAECAGGAAAWGGVRFEHQGAGWHIYLEHPGPFGVILQPAIALLVASSLALPLGVRYGCALGGTGVFAVMWLVAGAFGCLLSNAISVSGGPQLLPVGGALALAATVWLLTPRPGGSTFSRAQRAGALAERRFAAVALHELPGHGEYEAPHTRGIWGNLQSSFFVPSTVPRHVRWDEEGIEVEWLRGGPTRYHWDEVRRLENAANAVHVITSDGRTLEFYNTGRNYGELLSALRAHTWARNQDQAPGDADT